MDTRELASQVRSNKQLQDEFKQDPVAALERLATPLETDVWVYRIVVIALAMTVFTATLGGIILAVAETDVPEILVALGSAAVGALAGLLAPGGNKS
jgi:hypothetical protein